MADRPVRQIPGVYRRRIGDIWVTAISDGAFVPAHEIFRNLPQEERKPLLDAAFRPALSFSVNCFLIETGKRTILMETGCGTYLGPLVGHLPANLAAAGVAPGDIDAVLLTHMHPDHSAGLTDRTTGKRFYENAELVVHENEPRHWFSDEARARVSDLYKDIHFGWTREQVTPYLDRMRTFASGEVFPGITAVPLPGHTPGHTGYLISSGKELLFIWGDIVHAPDVQFPRPEVTMVPDTDAAAAFATRLRAFDMAAADRMLVTGMHLHFPGFGHVAKSASGYRFVPEAWRLDG